MVLSEIACMIKDRTVKDSMQLLRGLGGVRIFNNLLRKAISTPEQHKTLDETLESMTGHEQGRHFLVERFQSALRGCEMELYMRLLPSKYPFLKAGHLNPSEDLDSLTVFLDEHVDISSFKKLSEMLNEDHDTNIHLAKCSPHFGHLLAYCETRNATMEKMADLWRSFPEIKQQDISFGSPDMVLMEFARFIVELPPWNTQVDDLCPNAPSLQGAHPQDKQC